MEPHADRPQPPADQGLSSLGLIMTLTGAVMAPLIGATLLGQIKVTAGRDFGGVNDSQTSWLFLLLIASVVRSLVHRMAGLRLWRDVPSDPPALGGITTYLITAAGHTALWVMYLKIKVEAPVGALVGSTVLMMAWPVAIFAVTRMRRFQALGPRLPIAQDNGFEGLAVLMAILGFAGLMCSLVVGVIGFSVRGETPGLSNVLLIAGVALTVRSIIHFSVGARAVRGTAVNAAADFLRYANVGIAIGAGVGGIFSLWLLMTTFDFFGLATGVAVALALTAWPAIVRRFVTWRHLADVATDTVRRRSPDAGITALGWLLLAGAAISFGTYAGTALSQDGLGARSALMLRQMAGIPFEQDHVWWQLPLALGQLWAALELLAVTPRRRVVASAWAAAALVLTTITMVPDLKDLLDLPIDAQAAGFAAFLIGISPAVATLLLVNRAPLPPAVARVVKTFD